MGKIVKYCAACDESFAVKFGFCPNCGQGLTAFELNQVANETPVSESVPKEVVFEDSIVQTPPPVFAKAAPPVVETTPVTFTEEPKAETIATEQPEIMPVQTKTFAAAAAGANGSHQTVAEDYRKTSASELSQIDDGYHITVVEEKNGKQRNLLLLGSLALVLTMAFGSTVYSLFNKDLFVGSIGEESGIFIPIVDEAPMEVEEQQPKKDDDDGGGGGGGGKEEPEPASKGRLVSQSENPITPPSVNIPQMKNPSIPVIMETQGTIKRPITEERPGLPGSDNLNPSNGTGRGGGIGSGTGTGIGTGIGTGEGSGTGSGSGSGRGNGNGGGTGDGSGVPKPPPPPKPVPVGVTESIKIISKPQPRYTDAARQNQVQGTVTVKVTFNANGSIGSIAPVSGLPYGLTEQAIAAARSIKFEPAKRNGVPYSVAKTIAYTFTIY
jgi:TonB family protein